MKTMNDPIECNCEFCGLEFQVPSDRIEEIEATLTCPACQELARVTEDDPGAIWEDDQPDDYGHGSPVSPKPGSGGGDRTATEVAVSH